MPAVHKLVINYIVVWIIVKYLPAFVCVPSSVVVLVWDYSIFGSFEKTSSSKFENVFLILFVDSLFIILSLDRSIDRFISSSSRSLSSSSSLFFDRFYFQIIPHNVHEKSEGERRLTRCRRRSVRPAKTISRCCTKRRRRKQRRRFARTATTTRRRSDYSVHGSVAVSLAIRE